MIQQHLTRKPDSSQRRRWVEMLLETADELGLPDDPNFGQRFVGYFGVGFETRGNQFAAGCERSIRKLQCPNGWGEVKGPYTDDRLVPPWLEVSERTL